MVEGVPQHLSQRKEALANERPGTPASQLGSQGTDPTHFKGAFLDPISLAHKSCPVPSTPKLLLFL